MSHYLKSGKVIFCLLKEMWSLQRTGENSKILNLSIMDKVVCADLGGQMQFTTVLENSYTFCTFLQLDFTFRTETILRLFLVLHLALLSCKLLYFFRYKDSTG